MEAGFEITLTMPTDDAHEALADALGSQVVRCLDAAVTWPNDYPVDTAEVLLALAEQIPVDGPFAFDERYPKNIERWRTQLEEVKMARREGK